MNLYQYSLHKHRQEHINVNEYLVQTLVEFSKQNFTIIIWNEPLIENILIVKRRYCMFVRRSQLTETFFQYSHT